MSKSTVSLALQRSPLIKPETAAKVAEAAQKLGYVYHRAAASLRGGRSKTIGMIISDLMNPLYVELLVAIERVLAESGYTTVVAHTADNPDTQTRVLRSMREQNVAGIIMTPAFGTPDTLPAEIRSWGMPLVLVMRSLGRDTDTVRIDNMLGFTRATEHLLEQGHTRIAFADASRIYTATRPRRQAFVDTMQRHGLSVHDDWIINVDLSPDGGREAVRTIFALDPRPTALLCYNDQVAFGALHELYCMGKRAGHDLAVVGCDDVFAAKYANPPLTTLAVGMDKLGTVASQCLLSRLDNTAETTEPLQFLNPPELIVRESSVAWPISSIG